MGEVSKNVGEIFLGCLGCEWGVTGFGRWVGCRVVDGLKPIAGG